VCSVHFNASLGEVPKEVLDLVFAVLVLQQIDELMKPLFGEFDKQTPGVAELWVVWVQDIGSQDSAKVDDGLLVGWHETLPKSTDHLIRVQLLVELPLFRCQKQSTA
jgi:hypothetical protein